MKVKKIISLLVFILVVVLGILLMLFPKRKNSNTPQTSNTSNQTPISSATPTEQQYLITVISASKVDLKAPNDVTYKITIKNFLIKPYITNFAFYQCYFADNNEKVYKGSFMTETSLDKGIIPGESQTLSITSQANLDGYDKSAEGFKKCDYQQNGSKTCTIVANLRAKSCIAYITSDSGQASNGWGSNPISVNFPQ